MNKILMITVCMLIVSSVALAEETTTETCANGAGTIVIGAVTGHKYCMSNQNMNWWNANAWCDTQGKRLFDRSDCGCSNTIADCINQCPELTEVKAVDWVWIVNLINSQNAFRVRLSSGEVGGIRSTSSSTLGAGWQALCY